MSTEDILLEIYYEVEKSNLKDKFDKQIKKMKSQDKHKYKTVAERWDYALYRVKGGSSKEYY